MPTSLGVIRGVAITPPLIGRITMGHTELRKGATEDKAVPVKDDFFNLTTLVQNPDRSWEPHPIQAKLTASLKGREKLRAIPVRIAYNDPRLILHNSYSSFDPRTGRVLCTGNGETARRCTDNGVQEIACPRPEACEYGARNRCKNMSRAYFQVDGQEDDLGMFVLRSTSWNTLKSIASRLSQLHGLTNGQLAGIPMMLELKSKTTTQSRRTPIYYADLVFRPGMTIFDAVTAGRAHQQKMREAELNQDGMEAELLFGIANGDFADEIEDVDEWVSDEDLLASAEGNLRRQGLRGLDSLAQANGISGEGADAVPPDAKRAPPPLPPKIPSAAPAHLALVAPPTVEPSIEVVSGVRG